MTINQDIDLFQNDVQVNENKKICITIEDNHEPVSMQKKQIYLWSIVDVHISNITYCL